MLGHCDDDFVLLCAGSYHGMQESGEAKNIESIFFLINANIRANIRRKNAIR